MRQKCRKVKCWQPSGIESSAPRLSCQCSAFQLWQPGNRQPPQFFSLKIFLVSIHKQQMSPKCTNLLPAHAADVQDPNISRHLCLNLDLSHQHNHLLLGFCNVRVGVHQAGSGVQPSGTGPALVERSGTKWTLPSLQTQMWRKKIKCVGQI